MQLGNDLSKQRCIPCQEGAPVLSVSEIKDFLLQLNNNWQVNELGHLYKKYIFKDFLRPMKFANLISALAEKEGHHPDLSIAWGHCSVELWTHKINGLTPSDFYMAAKIEKEFSDNFS